MNDDNTSGDGGFGPSFLRGGGSDSPTETPGGTRPEAPTVGGALRKDAMIEKAGRLRERADEIEAAAKARAASPLAEHFPVGVGYGGNKHRPDVHKYADAMREVTGLRGRASSLEFAAQTQVFADDLAGLRDLVAKHERTIAELVAIKADPAKRAKYADVLPEMLASRRRKLRADRKRLEAAELAGRVAPVSAAASPAPTPSNPNLKATPHA